MLIVTTILSHGGKLDLDHSETIRKGKEEQ